MIKKIKNCKDVAIKKTTEESNTPYLSFGYTVMINSFCDGKYFDYKSIFKIDTQYKVEYSEKEVQNF